MKEARVAFESALALDPGNADARSGLEASTAPSFKKAYELSFFASQTRFSGERKQGLRFAQLAAQLRPDFRAWVQYDKGLGLDNADLARRNIAAEAYYLGGIYSYGGRYATRLELGRRNLPDGIRQHVVRGEQVFFLENGAAPKVGAWVGRRSDDRTEYITHLGIDVPVTRAFRLEPMVFYSKGGAGSEREVRGLLAGEYSFSAGYRLGAGFSGGRKLNAQGAGSSSEVFITFSAPLSGAVRFNGLARRQSRWRSPVRQRLRRRSGIDLLAPAVSGRDAG